MTAIMLQSELKKRIQKVLENITLPSQEAVIKNISVYEQDVPRKTKSVSRNPESTDFPYVIVYLDKGNNEQVNVLLVTAVFDDSETNQAHKDVSTILEKIMQDLHKNPKINNQHEMIECDWFLDDADTFPTHFGWIEAKFEVTRIISEEGVEFV